MVRLSVLILKEGGREGIGHSNTVGGRTFKNSDWRNTRDFHRDLLFYFAWYIFENIYACGSCHLCFGKSDSSHLALPTHPPPFTHMTIIICSTSNATGIPSHPVQGFQLLYRTLQFTRYWLWDIFYFYAAFQGTRIGKSSHFHAVKKRFFTRFGNGDWQTFL